MSVLRPFMSYYGGKWQSARSYPEPRYPTIVEPFAGGAGYSLRYPERDVILVEKNPKVAAIWRYLIGAEPDRIMSLPDVGPEGVDAHSLCDAERWLVGFWLNGGVASPCKTPSKWAQKAKSQLFWGERVRRRLASQVESIRHWKIIEGDFESAPDVEATWFVDPPYQRAGKHYPCNLSDDDFRRLAAWCRSRRGQTIVCENMGADWLPFRFHKKTRATNKNGARWSDEAVWLSERACVIREICE